MFRNYLIWNYFTYYFILFCSNRGRVSVICIMYWITIYFSVNLKIDPLNSPLNRKSRVRVCKVDMPEDANQHVVVLSDYKLDGLKSLLSLIIIYLIEFFCHYLEVWYLKYIIAYWTNFFFSFLFLVDLNYKKQYFSNMERVAGEC